MKIRILFTIGFMAVCLFSCKQVADPSDPLSNFKANQAELGEEYGQFLHDASFNCPAFPQERPAAKLTPKGVRVFYAGEVGAEELSLIDDGISETLSTCLRDTNAWSPGNVWTKFEYFTRHSDYKVFIVPSNYTLQEGEAAGCGGLITGPHGAFTAAGTVCGLVDRINSHTPASRGGIYITIPKQSAEQLARSECRALMKTAVRNEAEHVIFSNDSSLYFAFANDGVNGNHPYCGR